MSRQWILQGLYLLGSGLVAAAGFVLLSSGKTFNISQSDTSAFLLIIAFHGLAITAGVFGTDKQVLATSTGHTTRIRFSTGFLIWNTAVFVLSIFYLNLYFRLPVSISIIAAISIPLDSFSIANQSWLATQLRSRKVLISNILRYPLFFFAVYILGFSSTINLNEICVLFTTTASLRALYLFTSLSPATDARKLTIGFNAQLGLYQIINYLLFRGGQLIAGLILIGENPTVLAGALLYWKIIELLDKGFVYLLPVIFGAVKDAANTTKRLLTIFLSIGSSSSLLLAAFYLDLDSLGSVALALFLTHAFLVLPTNLAILRHYQNFSFSLVLSCGLSSLLATTALTSVIYSVSNAFFAAASWTPLALIALNTLLRRAPSPRNTIK